MERVFHKWSGGVVLFAMLASRAFAATMPDAPAPAPVGPIPIEKFAAIPVVHAPSISPDGNHLVYITQQAGKPVVATFDLAARTQNLLLSGESGNYAVQWCAFKNDQRVLCSFRGFDFDAGRPFGTSRLLALNIDGTKLKVLIQNTDAAGAQFQDHILHWLPDDPNHVILELDDDQSLYPSVFKLDVYTGRRLTVQRERVPVVSWMTDRSGVVRFGFGYHSEETSAVYLARATEDASWKVIEKFHLYDGQRFEPLGFGVRPSSLFVSAPNNGHAAVWEFTLDESKEVQLVFANPEADVDDAITWPGDGHLIGFHYETDRPHAFYIDELAHRIDLTTQQVLPGQFTSIIGASRDGKKVVLSAYSDVKPRSYYVMDLAAAALNAIGSENPSLANAALAPMKTISVPVGTQQIPGYLTLPVGKAPKNLPTVIYPHGGPYARDTWGYDPVVQMLASRGYAVLQLNFRGSTGLGTAWFEAGWRGWGTVIHDDITAGAHWVVDQGIADPKRMCIVGWSYGGYAALLGVERDPDLYKCAVSIAGVSDLTSLSNQESFFYGGRMSARESIGSDREALKNDSPLRHADRIKVPVLLVHGDSDFVVLTSHSENMAKELKRNKVPTELVIIKDGGHSLERQEMRLTLFQKIEAFLAANLGTN